MCRAQNADTICPGSEKARVPRKDASQATPSTDVSDAASRTTLGSGEGAAELAGRAGEQSPPSASSDIPRPAADASVSAKAATPSAPANGVLPLPDTMVVDEDDDDAPPTAASSVDNNLAGVQLVSSDPDDGKSTEADSTGSISAAAETDDPAAAPPAPAAAEAPAPAAAAAPAHDESSAAAARPPHETTPQQPVDVSARVLGTTQVLPSATERSTDSAERPDDKEGRVLEAVDLALGAAAEAMQEEAEEKKTHSFWYKVLTFARSDWAVPDGQPASLTLDENNLLTRAAPMAPSLIDLVLNWNISGLEGLIGRQNYSDKTAPSGWDADKWPAERVRGAAEQQVLQRIIDELTSINEDGDKRAKDHALRCSVQAKIKRNPASSTTDALGPDSSSSADRAPKRKQLEEAAALASDGNARKQLPTIEAKKPKETKQPTRKTRHAT